MKIAIDVSPLKTGHFLQHRVRGTGFYIENLSKSLLQHYTDNQYIFFTRGEKLPNHIDLVHIPYFEPFFLTLPFFSSHKYVVTIHDLTPLVFPEHFPSGLKGWLKWKMQKYNLKRADAIIADSLSSKRDINKYTSIPVDKIHVIYLAASSEFRKIDKSSILGSIRQKYNLPERFVLYVGDVTWNKNLPRLIEAVSLINVPLVVVGQAIVGSVRDQDNPWNKDLVKVQKLVVKNKSILCLGFVPKEDLVLIYNLATVFAMPSLYEGFGLPILEALSCGCPSVVSREGSIPEIAGNASYYVDAYDTNSISNGIKKVFFDNNLRKKLSLKGFEQAKKFSWKKTTNQLVEIYKGVASPN